MSKFENDDDFGPFSIALLLLFENRERGKKRRFGKEREMVTQGVRVMKSSTKKTEADMTHKFV